MVAVTMAPPPHKPRRRDAVGQGCDTEGRKPKRPIRSRGHAPSVHPTSYGRGEGRDPQDHDWLTLIMKWKLQTWWNVVIEG